MKKLLIIFILTLCTFSVSAQDVVKEPSTVEETIMPYVQKILKAAEQGANFVVEETPLVVQQYVGFYSAQSLFFILMGILLIVRGRGLAAMLTAVKSKEEPSSESQKSYIGYKKVSKDRWLRFDKDNDDSVTGEQVFFGIIQWVSGIVGIVLFFSYIMTFVKATFFPKLFIVERFIELL